MSRVLANDHYRSEYTKDFVGCWDELIGWEGRKAAENGFFERLLHANGARTVIDVGCGTGFHSVTLSQAGFAVTAADGSENMVARTRDNAEEHGANLVDAVVADWLHLDDQFDENSFDAMVCLGNAFTHLQDHEARRDALTSMMSILKPGGMLIMDQRNYDSLLDEGYSSKHMYYYTGKGVDARPVEITRRGVKFEYTFPSGDRFNLNLYPLRQDYLTHLLEDAGFQNVMRYGDFEKPYSRLDVDFIQQVAFKPHQPTKRVLRTKKDLAAKRAAADRTRHVVQDTREYYDGDANQIYKEIWGENIHLGLFETPEQDLPAAMKRSNDEVGRLARIGAPQKVLDVGCGYGAMARHLARTYHCQVLATNISDRELEWARELTAEAGLDDKVAFEWADFHDLPYGDGRFDRYMSQECFLHAADKQRVLREAWRVLKPGGRLVFTDILVRRDTPEEDRKRIYARLKTPDMWDAPDYEAGLKKAKFRIREQFDWSDNVAPTYGWVRGELERRRREFEIKTSVDFVNRTSDALKFWVDAANAGKIGWACFVAEK